MTNIPVKRSLAALGVAVVLGVAAVGVVGAQQPPTATRTPGPSAAGTPPAGARSQAYDQFLDAVAAKLGVTGDRLRQALADVRKDLGLPDRPGPGGFGGPRGRPGFRGPFGPHGPGFGGSLDAAAGAIGITVDQLRQELPGKSLTDVARAHNVDPNRVANALKADTAARIDQAVTNGRLAADRAAQLKQDANTHIDQLMTQQLPAAGIGPRGKPGWPGGPRAPRGSGTPGAPGTLAPGAQPSGAASPSGVTEASRI